MNPNIGVIGDFSYQKYFGSSHFRDGFRLNETEISFRMMADPFARADFFVAVVPPEEAIELEEGFITLLSLPLSLQARAGFFRNAFGKFNLTHPPETAIATPPLYLVNFFGEEGLAETGVSFSSLIPNPWEKYVEFSLDILNGDNDVSFSGGTAEKATYLLHLKNFLDLTENANIELGFSGMAGAADSSREHLTRLFGIDAIYRWKPLIMGRYRSFTLQFEGLLSEREVEGGILGSYGLFLFAQYQLARQWFAGVFYDEAGFPESDEDIERRISGLITFWPSEFQTIKLQLQRTERNFSDVKDEISLHLQWTFIIGAHGAHKF